MPGFAPGRVRQLEIDQDLSAHPQIQSWVVKGLRWPSWTPGASVHPTSARSWASNGQEWVLRQDSLSTPKKSQPEPLGRELG